MSDEELIARMRMVTGFIRFETGDRIAASACLSEEAADRIEALIAERDHWSGVARREGVCMICRGPNGAPEPYGCTDCLNTGYCGEHHNTVADLEAKLAKAVEFAEIVEKCGHGALWDLSRATLAKIKGESHE